MGLTEGSIFSGFPAIASPLAQFIVQLVVILGFTRLLVFALKPLKQPAVIAEVIAGILLGPSALCRISAFQTTVFPAASLPNLQLFANVALVLFMFTVGIELDFGVLTRNLRKSVAISIVGIVLPFGLGAAVAVLLNQTYPPAVDSAGGYTSFVLFGGTAMSITAFPVLARILSEQQLLGTRLGATVMNAAACDDVVAWSILALVIAISRASSPLSAVWTMLSTAAFVLGMFLVVNPILKRVAIAMGRKDKEASGSHYNSASLPTWFFVLVVLLCLASAYVTELLGVHAIFGAFVCGVIIPRHRNLHLAIGHKIEDLVVAIFLPLYFTYSGLRTRFNALDDGTAWGMVLLVIAAAMVGKLGGCSLAARLSGLNWRDSVTTGVFMNAKGLVELIVLNVGLDLGVLTPLVFAIFVFMALFTTFLTVPMIMLVNPPSRIIEEDKKVTRALEAAAAAAVAVAKSASREAGSADGGEETVIPATAAGVQSAFLAAFGPHFAPSLVSVAAALLQRPRGKAGGRRGQAELCHLLPVTERPSSYLHTMTRSAVMRVPASGLFTAGPSAAAPSAASAFHAALHSVTAAAAAASESPDAAAAAGVGSLDIVVAAAPVAADPAAVAEVEEDVTLLLGIERARHVHILDQLLLSQTYASDAASAISTAAGASDIILLGLDISSAAYGAAAPRRSISYGSSGSGAGGAAGADAAEGGMGGLLGALVNRLVPAHRAEDTVRSLKALAPSARVGVLVAPPASAFFGSAQVLRALLVIDDAAGEQDLLTTVGAAFAANGVSLQVLLLTDMLTAGLELGSRAAGTASLIGATDAVAVAVGGASPADSVAVQRTADEAARLLAAKLAVSRALAGPHATDRAVAAAATASVHVAHRSALELALRVLTADCVALYGAAFDLIVASGGAASGAPETSDTLAAAGFSAAGAAAAAAASPSADEVEMVGVKEAPIDAASVTLTAPIASDERAGAIAALKTTAAAPATLASIPAPTPAPSQLPTPARTFPEIAAARGAALPRRQSGRVRNGTLAHIFSREEAAAGASFLGACADRILGANLGCNVLVYLQPDAPAATA